jgi:hypothetical protein
MTQIESLVAVGKALYGDKHWQAGLTSLLGLADSSRIRKMLAGSRPIPPGIWEELEEALQRNKNEIESILPEIQALVDDVANG